MSSNSFREHCEKKKEKFLFISSCCYSLTDGNIVFYATVVTLSCMLFVSLVVIGVLMWRLRRALPDNRATTVDKAITDNVGQSVSSCDQHLSEPGSYMELHSMPSEEQSCEPPEYTALRDTNENPEYYNMGFNEGNKRDEQEEIYHEIGNAQC